MSDKKKIFLMMIHSLQNTGSKITKLKIVWGEEGKISFYCTFYS